VSLRLMFGNSGTTGTGSVCGAVLRCSGKNFNPSPFRAVIKNG
jgi:hypothetical protein